MKSIGLHLAFVAFILLAIPVPQAMASGSSHADGKSFFLIQRANSTAAKLGDPEMSRSDLLPIQTKDDTPIRLSVVVYRGAKFTEAFTVSTVNGGVAPIIDHEHTSYIRSVSTVIERKNGASFIKSDLVPGTVGSGMEVYIRPLLMPHGKVKIDVNLSINNVHFRKVKQGHDDVDLPQVECLNMTQGVVAHLGKPDNMIFMTYRKGNAKGRYMVRITATKISS